jgi:hypothetical protein
MYIGLFIAFAALIFLIVGIKAFQKRYYILVNGKKVIAIIFKNEYESSKSGGHYFPVVRFQTDKEEWITQKLNVGYSTALHEGNDIKIIYNPHKPTEVYLNSAISLILVPVIIIILGSSGFVLGLLEYLEVIQFFR